MSDCGTGCGDGTGGPMSEGRELVEFVLQAHDGAISKTPIPGGGLDTKCQGCGEAFTLVNFVGQCPKCQGVHAVSPPRCEDQANIQYAGDDFKIA